MGNNIILTIEAPLCKRGSRADVGIRPYEIHAICVGVDAPIDPLQESIAFLPWAWYTGSINGKGVAAVNIIDAHAHIYEHLTGFGPRGEARALGGGMVEWANGDVEQLLRPEHGNKEFMPETLLRLMDEADVHRAVLLQSPNYGLQNAFIAASVARFPDRFVGVGAFDPYCAEADRIFDNLTDRLGFRSLKLDLSEHFGLTGYHPDFDLTAPPIDRYLAQCEERGITVTVDTGTWGTASFRIDRLLTMLSRHPRLTFVVAHSLFPSNTDGHNDERLAYIRQLARDNVFFDTASLHPNEHGNHYPYLRAVMDIVGADHMMWGTDCPGVFKHLSYKALIDTVRESGYFTDTELTNLMHDTALRVYR
ncbi:MAG: amidohydrolase [Oscillospiraceae bacterium]|nr:amidohydrolase [Oscillospiraceae bacterium]